MGVAEKLAKNTHAVSDSEKKKGLKCQDRGTDRIVKRRTKHTKKQIGIESCCKSLATCKIFQELFLTLNLIPWTARTKEISPGCGESQTTE